MQLQIAHRRVGPVPVGLVHGEDVGALQDARLDRLHLVAHPRRGDDQGGVRHPGDLELVLPDADGLDQHDVRAPGVEHPHDVHHRARQPAERARASPATG